jgi:hypothetical protein
VIAATDWPPFHGRRLSTICAPGAEVERAAFYTWPTPPGLPARPIGGPDRGAVDQANPPRRGRRPQRTAISLAPTAPALPRGKPQGLVPSPLVRPLEPGASITGRQLGRPPSPRWARSGLPR